MMGLSDYLSMITLNVNGLNSATKKYRLDEWSEKEHPAICCQQESHVISTDTHT